jgi:hypothetical protein
MIRFNPTLTTSVIAAVVLTHVTAISSFAGFRVKPYLIAPEPHAVTVVWFSDDDSPGILTLASKDGPRQFTSTPSSADALTYHPAELDLLAQDVDPSVPYKHMIRVTGLIHDKRYAYKVEQGGQMHEATLFASPSPEDAVRFIVFADCETEPESTGKPTNWPQPGGDADRVYVADQTDGFKQNLRVIQGRAPGFIAFAGDLTQSGGEQRDWDEFWRHLSGSYGTPASSIPIVAAPGNHDAYGGPNKFGKFGADGNQRANAKFRTYFETAHDKHHPPQGYHRMDYGPITLISLDSTNGLPDSTDRDTNWLLTGRDHGHDFNPGSHQYRWLEEQLADAQKRSMFTFVQFHHVPYSVGPHGFPAGDDGHSHGQDNQSGIPMRVLTPLFIRYGVDAVFAGHDEMYEHSVIRGGVEHLPGPDEQTPKQTRPHDLHVWDVGIAGDGLRGPFFGPGGRHQGFGDNEHQVFLADQDAPEVWDGKRLVSGGKHYGHLEVNVSQNPSGQWQAILTPAYVFPMMNEHGEVTGWERRVYDDQVTLTGGLQAP